jgi:hypothetical protein
MFCPVCKAEYRQGITVCADCHVALAPAAPTTPGETAGNLVEFWEGDDLALYSKLKEALSDAGIRYYERPLGTRTRKESLFWLEGASHIMFSLAVLSADLVAARRILEELLDQEPEDVSLPAEDSGKANAGEGSEREVPEDWDPASATVEVWSGEDRKLAEFLTSALRESGIPSRTENQDSRVTVLVLPDDEARAREIVREVAESRPPE